MNYEEQHRVEGGAFGEECVDELIERAEAVSLWEQQRIKLVNEAPLVATKAECAALLEEEKELKVRLARLVPVPGIKVRQRRIVINWIVASILILSGFVLSILTLEPFRLGFKGVVYAIGIALVVPYLVERTLDHFPSAMFKRVLVAFACLAGMTSMILLATIRGNLLGEQVKQDQASAAVIEGEEQQTPRQNTFYEDTVPLLQLVMALLALAMEVGAGIAVLEAERMSDAVEGEYEMVRKGLREVQTNLAGFLEKIVNLQNEGPIFVARFWRGFYWSLLKGTIKNAAKWFVLPGMVLIIMICPHAWAAGQGIDLVVAVDLSKSIDEKGLDGKTSFEKNLAAVTELLGKIPAGTRVTVIGITGNSFSDPYIILKANLGADEGYFGEKVARGRAEIVRVWKAQSARLRPDAKQTDILGALFLAGELFKEHKVEGRRILAIYSDMRQATPELNVERGPTSKMIVAFNQIKRSEGAPELAETLVMVVGARNHSQRTSDWATLRDCWIAYFKSIGAALKSYSSLSETPELNK